jgi:hypothetical protein
MKETHEKKMTLDKEDTGVFELFRHWVWHREFPNGSHYSDPFLVELWKGSEMTRLVQLNIFADHYDVPCLHRDTVDKMFNHVRNKSKAVPGRKEFDLAFTWLPDDSPMCRLIVDLRCYYDSSDSYDALDEETLPPAALLCLLRRYAHIAHGNIRPRRSMNNYKLDVCDYHNHSSTVEKDSCGFARGHCSWIVR